MRFHFRKCGKVCLLFVLLTGCLYAQNSTAIDTLSKNKISEVEFNAFWSEFKDFCKTQDTSLITRFIAPIVTTTSLPYEQGVEHATYPLDKIARSIKEQKGEDRVLPSWQPEMDSIRIGRPLLRYLDQRNTRSWSIGPSYEDPEYVYSYAKFSGGPVSMSTYYYFKKFNGEIKFFKTITYEY